MKNYLYLFLMISFVSFPSFSAKEVAIGEEFIKPLRYPKVFLRVDGGFKRNKFLGQSGNILKPDDTLGGAVGFEAGLVKYFNAGAMINLTASMVAPPRIGTMALRMLMFAKPYYGFGNRLGVYARFSLGPSIGISNEASHGLARENDKNEPPTPEFIEQDKKFKTTFGNSFYNDIGIGINGAASVGIDFFPLSRVGIFAEWGIRADSWWFKKQQSYFRPLSELQRDPRFTGVREFHDDPQYDIGPAYQNFIFYELPVSIGINVIL